MLKYNISCSCGRTWYGEAEYVFNIVQIHQAIARCRIIQVDHVNAHMGSRCINRIQVISVDDVNCRSYSTLFDASIWKQLHSRISNLNIRDGICIQNKC